MLDMPEGEGLSQRRLPGESGIWVLLSGDLVVFGIFFIILMIARMGEPAQFAHGRAALDQALGALNTFLLLTSSLCVALAVRAMKPGSRSAKRAPTLLAIALLLGAGFIVVKACEWSGRWAAGQTVTSDDFFMYYFMYTGIHLMHVAIGLVILTLMLLASRRPRLDTQAFRLIESGAVFWHLVDLLWLVLFALFYLIR